MAAAFRDLNDVLSPRGDTEVRCWRAGRSSQDVEAPAPP